MSKLWVSRNLLAAAFLAALTAPAAAQIKADALSALAQLNSLRVAQTLQLDRTKAASILPTLEELDKQRAALAAWATAQWQANRTAVEATLRAWRPDRPPEATGAQACARLHEDYLKNLKAYQQAVEKAATAVLAAAGVAQGVVEDPQAAEQRREMERRFDGSRSAAEFIVNTAEALRLLMADDYAIVRLPEAERVARRLGAREPVAADPLTATVLSVLDDLMTLPVEAFTTQRAALLRRVGQIIGEPESAAIPPVLTWDAFTDWLKAPETLLVLRDLAGQPGSTAPAQVPEEFLSAMHEIELMWFFEHLEPNGAQAAAISELLTQIQVDLRNAEAKRAEVAAEAPQLLGQVKAALTAGDAIPTKLADAVQKLLARAEEVEANLRRAMVENIAAFQRLLSEPQRSLVYWQPDGAALRAMPRDRRAESLRHDAALIADAVDFLNAIKFQRSKRYRNVKVQFTDDFVAQYVDPNSPDFDAVVEAVLEVVRQARYVTPEDWESGADVEYGARVIRAMGLLQELEVPAPENEQYDWRDLYELLTDSRAVAMAQTWMAAPPR